MANHNLWAGEDERHAQQLILALLEHIKGPSLPLNDFTICARYELTAISNCAIRRDLLIKALEKMKAQGKNTLTDFDTIYSNLVAVTPDPAIHTWSFYVPIRVKLASDIDFPLSVVILGAELEILPRAIVEERIGNNAKILRDPMRLSIELGRTRYLDEPPNVYIVFSQKESSLERAWASVGPTSFDAFRGMMELTMGMGEFRMGTELPRSKAQLHGWMFVTQEGQEYLEFGNLLGARTDERHPKAFDMCKARWERILRNAACLFTKPDVKDSTVQLIANCLALYSSAMDEQWNYACLLFLWRFAEAITLAERFGGDTNKVASRLAIFGEGTELAGSGYRHGLRLIARKRNDIVHRGIYSGVSDDDVNILKLACEIALDWLVAERENLPTQAHLEAYYEYRSRGDSEIQRLHSVLGYIEAKRGIR